MSSNLKTKNLEILGMTCISCQNRIEKKLRSTKGIKSAVVKYRSQKAEITFDESKINLVQINDIIAALGYEVTKNPQIFKQNHFEKLGFVFIVFALFLLIDHFGLLALLAPTQNAAQNMQYGMLFVIGLITSVHCVAMCGGINLSQTIKREESSQKHFTNSKFESVKPAILYNLGRVISYTGIGFLVGAFGSVFSISTTLQGVLKIIAGVFMLIMGSNMLNLFPFLRRFTPSMPKIFTKKINQGKQNNNSSFVVGLLNGLMPCGPLQAMQIYALSTGNAFAGAFSMFLFSLGTVPLMFTLGALSGILGKKFTKQVLTVGAVLVLVLSLDMLSQGFILSRAGLSMKPQTSVAEDTTKPSEEKDDSNTQIINSKLGFGGYPNITVKAGTPVKWIIEAPQGSINGCNNSIIIPLLNRQFSFNYGKNIIEFTPNEVGTHQYTCWMGMLSGSITVES